MKAKLTLLATLISLSSMATERTLSFNFNVKSSGADLYACNAGLMHEPNQVIFNPGNTDTTSSSDQVENYDYTTMTLDEIGQVSCDAFGGKEDFITKMDVTINQDGSTSFGPTNEFYSNGFLGYVCLEYIKYNDQRSDGYQSPSSENFISTFSQFESSYYNSVQRPSSTVSCDDSHNCSTVTVNNTDDYMVASYKHWVGNRPTVAQNTLTKTIPAGSNDYTTVILNANSTDESGWGSKVMTNVDFFLGSDLFGAKYFVDFCYRGNQIDYPGFNTALKLKAEAMIKQSTKYGKWSGLEATVDVVCNTESGEVLDSTVDPKAFVGVSKVAINLNTTLANDEVKNCHIRYSFEETNKTSLRPHELTDQKVYLYTSIKEHHKKTPGNGQP